MIDDPDLVPTQADPALDDATAFDDGCVDDPFATRVPGSDDPNRTRAEGTSTTLPDPSGGSSSGRRLPPGVPRFRIIRPHARGALGEVFLALDEELRREVALKEIQDRHADDPRNRARFLLEAEVTGSLEHPGIVPVYGLGHHPDGRPYYAMRFIRGDSLKESVDRHYKKAGAGAGTGEVASRVDPAERILEFRKHLRKFVDICNAIAYAHSRGVLHRDLKPGNVMLGPYGETLVVDWGLAKSLTRPGADDPRDDPAWTPSGDSCSSETVAGSVIGTPAFMSPEQAAGDLARLGPASDIYSLGATLYYVLTGKTPFDGLGVLEILARVQTGEFPPPREVRRDTPRALQAICLKAMATRPEDRYPTARALADDLEHWLAGASVSAYPDRLVTRLSRWCRRHPVLTTVAMSCLFLDACCLVISLLLYVERVLHAGSMPRLEMATGILVFIPFAGQLGAVVGSAAGAMMGAVWRRTLAGVLRGAGVGLKVGVPAAIVVFLGLGTFGVFKAPKLIALFTKVATPVAAETIDWPKLPGASKARPSWIGPEAPADVEGHFVEPPAQENAAPLYLDALIEFDERMAPCFSPEEGTRRAAIAEARRERLRIVDLAWRADRSTVDRRVLDALLEEEYEVGFLKLKQAQRRPACVFRIALDVLARIPHAQAAREAAKVGVIRAQRRLERGEVDRAIDDLAVLLRLARDLRPRGSSVVQLVSGSIEGAAGAEILLPILREPGLRLDQADRLLAALDDHSSVPLDPHAEWLRAEYVSTGQSIHAYLDRLVEEEYLGGGKARSALRSLLTSVPAIALDGNPADRPYEDWMEVKIDASLEKTTPEDFAESSRRAYDEFHRAMSALSGLPLTQRIAEADRLPSKMLDGHPLILYLAPNGGVLLKAFGRYEATRGALKCLVALRRWGLAGRGEPVDLGEVVRAAGMAKVPVDPFRPDGGPLRMALDRGRAVIYSIGPDGVDDGGLLDARMGAEPRGDFVYRLDSTAFGREGQGPPLR